MLTVRKAADRGHADHGWLNTNHTFSFADYFDRRFMGFGPLRVINDDTVAPGRGFAPHSHQDMEIVSYVLEGELEHKDSMGTGSVIKPGDVQRMSAGKGVTHSEYNASKTEPVHFLQIWIIPSKAGIEPGYEQKNFSADEKKNVMRLVASPDGASGSVRIEQDARLFASIIERGATVKHAFASGRNGWLHVARGSASINGTSLRAGDGVAISDEKEITLGSNEGGEILLFDLPRQ